MCGIFGCVGGAHAEPVIGAAVARLAHRGPDDAGVARVRASGPEVWLGFRRLSILDLSARGHQPMSDARGETWIVFNGEVYNFRELRRALEAKGHAFRSDTDTEVVLGAYREWGVDAVERLVGMFAFAVWDARRRQLVLARDRLGIKPLYYHCTASQLAFASEVKALLALPEVERRLEPAAAAKFFNFLWVPEPETLFAGVRQLEPGSVAVYRDGHLETRRYWDVPLEPAGAVDEAEAIEALDASLRTAVADRLVSDVPLGAFLSGGVDSSLIVALMREAGVPRITTWTVECTAEDARYAIEVQDAPYARKVRDHFGDLDYHEILLRPRAAELLPRLVWHLDDPVADPAALSTYLICRAARENATVMLSGMGAEELFAGYGRHRAALLAERYRLAPRALRQRVLEPAVARLPASRPGPFMTLARNAKKFVRSAGLPFEERYLGYVSYYTPAELAALLGPAAAAADVFAVHRAALARARGADPVMRMSYLDLKTFLPNLNLTYTDRASMAASVEVRVPLLDHRVVELVAGLPSSLKLRGRTRKYALKRVAARYLPRDVVTRPKTGFSAPVRAWVQRDLRPLIEEVLAPDRLRRRGVLDPAEVWRIIRDVWSGREDNALRVWAFLTFELWAETFLDRDGSAALAV
ncbi:MAG TPA: asparagine synthase (glutamine-hydrolyzing) [Longimicrobiales bacterium]